ncbi:carboxymuconolactone decarboxylase family protein [Euryhalocaulis caribicus]|uniref:carboxymuconolactone decarboxylase family protein n=1 Tax=Euryhalocaulis caribicus TaxID=1161401 RepID=UPI0003A06432|nr:carboxymuconolactone decarboxylase family protein [Euryhalocaulis caribicus]
MTRFKTHTPETAPEGARDLLKAQKDKLGFVPNLYGNLAESPAALKAYLQMTEIFAGSSLSTAERHVVWLAAAAENECHYCVAAHTGMAKSGRVDDAVIEAIREGDPIADDRLETLRVFTETVIRERGWAPEEEVAAFIEAGFTRENVLEVVLGVAHKTLSNYVNHITGTALDKKFGQFSWDGAGIPDDASQA